jgi:hypothetical protein
LGQGGRRCADKEATSAKSHLLELRANDWNETISAKKVLLAMVKVDIYGRHFGKITKAAAADE